MRSSPMRRHNRLFAGAAVAVATALALTACAEDPTTTQPGAGSSADVAAQQKDQALYDQLPDKVKQAGKLISVNNGSFPPYEIVGADGKSMTGASADLTEALSQ